MATVVLFGHGVYDPAPTNRKAKCKLTFYGPFGAFLTRAVARAIINLRGDMTQGCTRLITEAAFEKIKEQFGGECPSFDKAVWKGGTQNTLTEDIPPQGEVPNLTLLPDTEEAGRYGSIASVRMVTKSTSLADIQDEYKSDDVLIWAACADLGGKGTPQQQSVILEPAMQSRLYPTTMKELENEERYQGEKRKLQEMEKQKTEFASKKPKIAEVEIPASVQETLKRDFKPTDDLDEQAERLKPLLTQHPELTRRRLFVFLSENKLKGQDKAKPMDLQNATL